MIMLKRMLTLSVLIALAFTVGCSYDGGVSTTGKWMAGGAVVGGTVGGIIGAHHGEAGCGVLIGALSGATAGGIVGNIIEEKEIKNKIAEMQAEIDRLKAELDAKNKALADANRRIAELEAEVARLKAELAKGGQMLSISLGSDVLFRPGSAVLSDAGKRALDDAAAKIKSQYAGKFIMVEGHTDSDPIRVSGWKSNWELGAARSLTVLHYLADKAGVDPANMSAATFSKYQPIASNDSREGKAQNRRAVIAIYNSWNKPAPAK